METPKDGDEKPEPPTVFMHPIVDGIEYPTVPPYAQKALCSQALTKRLEKKASRYLQVLQEREMLAKAISEGTKFPPYVKRSKRLPIWWSDAEDTDLLRGAHKHGHRNFCKIREDKSLLFPLKLEMLKYFSQERGDPLCQDITNTIVTGDLPAEPLPCVDQEAWPQDAALAMRLRQLIQALRTSMAVPDRYKDKVVEESASKSCADERGRIASLPKMHPHYEPMPPKRPLSASASPRQPGKATR
ncbi:hypothetical protein L7F22_000818 [Adiantum nelumboides]|nr:hypothetical protein [Adiantum nelumboides]